jgi:broad specificity phosphatase PhoE
MRMDWRIGEVLLYLVRHGEVDADRDGLIRGLQNDELNETGQKQAKEIAWYFKRHPLSAIFTDDLERTYQTALPTGEAQELAIGRDPGLRSWDVGSDLEGKSIEAHKAEIAQLKAQKFLVAPGGQSWAEYEDQVMTAFDRYEQLAMSLPHPIALFVHGSFLSIVAERLGAAEMKSDYEHTFLEPGGIAALYLTRSDGLAMKAIKGGKENADE